MKTFLIIVSCVHINNCPIPHGYKLEMSMHNNKECVSRIRDKADSMLSMFGFSAKDFSISCREK